MKAIKIKDKNRLIAYLYFYLDYNPKIKNRADFVADLIKDMHRSKTVGFAGCRTRNILKTVPEMNLFGPGEVKKIPQKINFNRREILKITQKAILRCHKVISSGPIRIFIFPAFDSFTIKRLHGVKGFCYWKRSIIIYLNPRNDWKTALKQIISHEFNHSVVSEVKKSPMYWSLLEDFIYEGFATNFEEELSGECPVYAKALSKKDCKKWFLKTKRYLNLKGRKRSKLYEDLFYKAKNYPLWAGYSIAYQIVKDFRKKNPNLKWQEIIKISPQKVLKESEFGKL